MLEEFLERLAADRRSRGNPLGPHLSPFAASLVEDGYAGATTQAKLWLLCDFGQWLARRELSVMVLDERLVEKFINNRRQKGRLQRGDGETLRQFLKHLRGRHIAPEPHPIRDGSRLAQILNRYEKHLRSERGVVTSTVVNYLPFARKFLLERFAKGPLLLRKVSSSDISAFVLRHAQTMARRRVQLMATAFRSFFRFLFQNGELQANLAAAVPRVADWRLSTVPKYLVPEEVDRVLGGCDRQTSTGRRDYAILLLLARLGLRAGEVVRFNSMTLTGGPARSWFEVRGCCMIGCLCLWMSEKRLPFTCAETVLHAKRGVCSFA